MKPKTSRVNGISNVVSDVICAVAAVCTYSHSGSLALAGWIGVGSGTACNRPKPSSLLLSLQP